MLKKLNLQTIFLFAFGILLVAGVFVFAGLIPSPRASEKELLLQGKLVVWGTIPKTVMEQKVMAAAERVVGQGVEISYIERNPATFDDDLIEKLASGSGPDIVLLPESLIVRHRDKIYPFPYESYTEREFRDTFIQEGELYLFPEGVLALPFSADPMVMYWNRPMFSSGSVVRPPAYWDEFLSVVPAITKKDKANNILKAALAFGEYQNVTHAKDILSLLVLQTGNPLTHFEGRSILAVLTGDPEKNFPPAKEVFRFYTDFADPQKSVYTWNRSLAQSQESFLAQDLAVYFGFASELHLLQTKNPNLDFGVALMPQIRDYQYRGTLMHMSGAAVMKTSQNKPLAQYVARALSSQPVIAALSKQTGLPPVRLDLLAKKPTNPAQSVFHDSALIGKSWLDPDPETTAGNFREAVEGILSGTTDVSGAVGKMNAEIMILGRR